MRQRIIHILFIALLTMVLPFNTSATDTKIIDFNYPQDVSKEALSDLNKALARGNGELTVDALVRYSIAQSGISKDNMPEIVKRLESTIAKEKQPHIKSLLYYFEALVYLGYRNRYSYWGDRNNPVEETPADLSEWDRSQFDKKINELIEKSLANPKALKAVAVTSLPGIITCNELGATYVPTLHEFLLMKGLDLTRSTDIDNNPLADRIKADWFATTEGDVPANIYAIVITGKKNRNEAYEHYCNNEYCAYLLHYMTWENDKERYKTLNEYVERFPNSLYTPMVKNMMIPLERKSVLLSYPEISSSRDSIKVKAHVMNVNDLTIEIYRISETEYHKGNNHRFDKSMMKLVSRHSVKVQGDVPFDVDGQVTTLPPLSYGAYVICPVFDGDSLETSQWFNSGNILHVTDIATFTVSRNDHDDRIVAVDISTGKPLPGVDIKASKSRILGSTGSDGTLAIPSRYDDIGKYAYSFDERLTAIKLDDHYGLPIYSNAVNNSSYSDNSADIYTDLGVYRPGETIHWAAIAYVTDENGRSILAGKKIVATFLDSNHKPIDTLTLTTDTYGRIEGTFLVPKDRMNGNFRIQLQEKGRRNDYLATINVNVSEYKTPTFEVTFPDARHSYVAGQPVKVAGKVMTYSGLPIQNTEVSLVLIQNHWSWSWWRRRNNFGSHLMDTTIMTDEQGNFTIEFPAELFEENKDYKPGKRFYWARNCYSVSVRVTNGAGETQDESTSFIVGTRRGIELGVENDNIYLNDKPIKLPLKYNTTDEEHPNTFCTWEIIPIDGKEPVMTGNFDTSDPTINLTTLPSGQYTLKIRILDAEEGEQEDIDVNRDIILYCKTDKTSPVKDCPLWLSPLQQSVDKRNKGHITVGVSTPKAYIYYIASTYKDVISEGWLNYEAGMNEFTVPLPKKAGADVTVSFITYYGTKLWRKEVTLVNQYKAEALKITATSFRDKLVPGDTEHWSFTLTDQNNKRHAGAMLLGMFDKAIGNIAKNNWNFSIYSPNSHTFNINALNLTEHSSTSARCSQKFLDNPVEVQARFPQLYTYGQSPFSNSLGRGRKTVKSESWDSTTSKKSTAATGSHTVSGTVLDGDDPVIGASVRIVGTNEGTTTDIDGKFTLNCAENVTLEISSLGYNKVTVKAYDGMQIVLEGDNSMLDEVVVTGYAKVDKRLYTESFKTAKVDFKTENDMMTRGDTQVNEKNFDKVTLRESDVKTALWMPMLTSDKKGNISVEFEVPNFNTTWITQAVAWDTKMTGSTWMAQVLTQKPLMVRSSMPRFLRQGDKATLAATVQNATDEASVCDAIIELFDPRTNDVYATRKFNLTLEPSGSQAVTIDWQVPDTIAMVGFRIKAANSTFGDGEQVMVPVLTTISPVIETEPFYIEAGQNHHEATIPKLPSDARVTLEYCDNPVWYCVLALPTIFSDQYNVATHAAHSLFALLVAQGVAKSQPQIKEAIAYWKEHNEDSVLVSMLQKNQDLKIGTLLASPWMRAADCQTLRMSKLYELFDEATTKKEYEKIITALQSLQMDDGGFTWFRYPSCKSNVWTTGYVLEMLGEIKRLGFLPDDKRLTSMIKHALSYYNAENVRLYNKALKNSQEPYGQFTEFAYIRSLFPDVNQSSASAALFKKVLNYMDNNWDKGITLKQKAYYAMTLYRNDYGNTAHAIIESIRQFAIVKPTLGMYWDNLQTDYGWWDLDKVAYTSVILQAMNEIEPISDEIDLIRKWMLLMKQSNDWGSYSLAADAVYTILSTGTPWLERDTTPTITVAGQPVNLDKMAQWLGYFRTSLPATAGSSIVIDRTGKNPAWGTIYSQFKSPMTEIKEKAIEEMSISKEYYVYAQNGSLHQATSFKVGDKVRVRVIIKTNTDMEFVTMTDERAACFEPLDQLSGYRSEDNTWFYQETKDTQTNAFITRLNKGTHIIGYDVWVTNPGKFTSGIATVQCQYAPQLSAHSAGKTILVNPKE